jgi:superfamily II DNA helicase RecQ
MAKLIYGEDSATKYMQYLGYRKDKVVKGTTLSTELKIVFLRYCSVEVGLQTWRQFAVSIATKKLLWSEPNIAVDHQAAHSSSVRIKHYGISSKDAAFMNGDLVEQYFRVSQQWHILFGLGDTVKGTVSLPVAEKIGDTAGVDQSVTREPISVPTSSSSISSAINYFSFSQMPIISDNSCEAEILVSLRQFLKDQAATFKSSQQCLAIVNVIRKKCNQLVILPTGGGKSFIFLLPVALQPGTSVLILPLRALIHQFIGLCNTHGITFHHWTAESKGSLNLANPPKLLIVSIESAVTAAFRSVLRILDETKRLNSIFYDECHLLLCSSYREVMMQFPWLRSHCALHVFLTATLPPCMELEFQCAMGLKVDVLRSPTLRKNLSYRVLITPTIDTAIGTLVNTHLANVFFTGRIIVFCLVISELQDLLSYFLSTSAYPVACYHGEMESKDREANQDKWISGVAKIMLCTAAFGAGIDFPEVSLVIHRGLACSLINFAQETGRGGRSGSLCLCVTVTNPEYMQRYLTVRSRVTNVGFLSQSEASLTEEVIQYINMQDCRRAYLHRYLDGEGLTCLLSSSVPCDNCQRRVDAMVSGNQLFHSLVPSGRDEASWISDKENTLNLMALKMVQVLDDLSGTCLLCVEEGKTGSHSLKNCDFVRGKCLFCLRIGHGVAQCPFKRIQSKGMCFICGFPRQVGEVWVHTETFGSCSSRTMDKLFPCCWLAWNNINARAQMKHYFPQSESAFADDRKFADWLVQSRHPGWTNACELFVWYFNVYKQ